MWKENQLQLQSHYHKHTQKIFKKTISIRSPQKLYMIFLIIVLLFGSSHGKLPPFWPITVVTMTNCLGNKGKSGPLLTVHCKSKEDDLGVHKLAVNRNYHFKFQTNIWKSTLFFCSFKWNKQVNSLIYFDALRDIDECHYQCNWTIKARAGSEDSRMKHWPRPPSFLKIFYIGLSLQTLIPVPKIFRILKKYFKPPNSQIRPWSKLMVHAGLVKNCMFSMEITWFYLRSCDSWEWMYTWSNGIYK